ncbi:cell division protein FtsK [Priestia flexa]|uniref:FtsK/SpoIIIE domain-containing protein n=1 Tax=Priestia flexa TaxID=86664 RepID=UPI001EF434F7|nr:cell division protein FtsK [Priestia flexa]
MIFEILSSIAMSSVLASTYVYQHGGGNDAKRIERIAANAGLVAKDGQKIRIHRRTRGAGYTEYVYQMPQGMSVNQFKEKLDRFQDGLNIKRRLIDVSFEDMRSVQLNKDILTQVRSLFERKRSAQKEIELTFDGMLRFKVYTEALTDHFSYTESLSRKLNGWQVPVGINRAGKLIKHDFEATPHLALGGATRYGKSNFLNALISSLISTQANNVSFTLIDLKGGVEFGGYENVNQVKRIAYEPEEALVALEQAYKDMRTMQETLRKLNKRKVQDTHITERHFILIDEVGELNPQEAVTKEERQIKEQCQKYMSQIARLGAGLGFRQVLATQYPTGDVIPRQCKQNSEAKLCFRVRNAVASRVVLDEEGAEKLPLIKGRAIYQTDQTNIVQTPFIDDNFIQNTIGPYINITSRKEPYANAESDQEGTTSNRDMLIIEEV